METLPAHHPATTKPPCPAPRSDDHSTGQNESTSSFLRFHLPQPSTRLAEARRYVDKVPGAIEGQGGDKATYALTCTLVNRFDLTGDEALSLLCEWNKRCSPPWRESALARKVRCAGSPCTSPGSEFGFTKWPLIDHRRIAEIVATGVTLAQLAEMNPCEFDGDGPHTERILDYLFPGNPLLCCAEAATQFATRPREEWRGSSAHLAYIVPNAMARVYGVTADGRRSERTKTNVGPRQYIVTEFDTGTVDEQAAILFHLAHIAPLVLVLHSGGKSLHGWFRCTGAIPQKILKFFRYAVALGADDQQYCACQLVRMPDGTRENGKRQQVRFFNPKGVIAWK